MMDTVSWSIEEESLCWLTNRVLFAYKESFADMFSSFAPVFLSQKADQKLKAKAAKDAAASAAASSPKPDVKPAPGTAAAAEVRFRSSFFSCGPRDVCQRGNRRTRQYPLARGCSRVALA